MRILHNTSHLTLVIGFKLCQELNGGPWTSYQNSWSLQKNYNLKSSYFRVKSADDIKIVATSDLKISQRWLWKVKSSIFWDNAYCGLMEVNQVSEEYFAFIFRFEEESKQETNVKQVASRWKTELLCGLAGGHNHPYRSCGRTAVRVSCGPYCHRDTLHAAPRLGLDWTRTKAVYPSLSVPSGQRGDGVSQRKQTLSFHFLPATQFIIIRIFNVFSLCSWNSDVNVPLQNLRTIAPTSKETYL
jgi:hypothetical protein